MNNNLKRTHKNDFDIKGNLSRYFPIFFELLGSQKLDWKKITTVFSNKVDEWILKYEREGKLIKVEASFYNIITASIQGNESASRLLDFYKKLFEELITQLNPDERVLTTPALNCILKNMGKSYLNFIGELCVLHNFKRSGELTLIQVESPLLDNEPEGTKIDFKFQYKKDSTFLLIEVVNVHLTEVASMPDEKIERLLYEKIQLKLNRTGIRKSNSFWLVPVFWGPKEDLLKIHHYYKAHQTMFEKTLPPFCFMSFFGKGILEHRFGSLESIVQFIPPSSQ